MAKPNLGSVVTALPWLLSGKYITSNYS